jgi:truncated hemoglobin YjbI
MTWYEVTHEWDGKQFTDATDVQPVEVTSETAEFITVVGERGSGRFQKKSNERRFFRSEREAWLFVLHHATDSIDLCERKLAAYRKADERARAKLTAIGEQGGAA